MKGNLKNSAMDACNPFDISDDDVLKAMKDINGYLDITPGDFKELYRLAFTRAVERLTHLFKARDVMTEKVHFVKKDTLSEEIAGMMAKEGVSGVPVVDSEEKVIGVISEKDFLFHLGTKDSRSFMDVVEHCLKNKGCLALSMRKQTAEDIMTSPAITVSDETPVFQIAGLLTEKKISRVPVTDLKNKLIGIVSRADIVQASCALPANAGDKK
jgi:CBS domain-containing membrane protein